MEQERLHAFQQNRAWLARLAYRMLGSAADAEDVLQEAWLRWQSGGTEEVRQPRAWLRRIVVRLCLDRLRAARRQRESYVGPWLPEALPPGWPGGDGAAGAAGTEPGPGPEERLERESEVSYALMLALERLSPLERAAFLLHDVFELDYAEIAADLDRSEEACRQLAARGRARARSEAPRFAPKPEEGQSLARAFLAASRSGDLTALRALLARDALLLTDGGGRKPAALNPVRGRDRVARFYAGLVRKFDGGRPRHVQAVTLDGLPGFLSVEADGTRQLTLLQVAGGRIAAIYVQRNPDKLAGLPFPAAGAAADSRAAARTARPAA